MGVQSRQDDFSSFFLSPRECCKKDKNPTKSTTKNTNKYLNYFSSITNGNVFCTYSDCIRKKVQSTDILCFESNKVVVVDFDRQDFFTAFKWTMKKFTSYSLARHYYFIYIFSYCA